MSAKILSLLHKAVPPAIAARGLSLLDSRIGNFMTGALQSGYTIDTALDYLRNKFSSEQEEKSFGNRPDERAAAHRVKQGRAIPNLIQKGATLGGAVLGGISAARGEETEQPQAQSPSQVAQPPFIAEESKQPPKPPAEMASQPTKNQQQDTQAPTGNQQGAIIDPFQAVAEYSPDIAEVLKQYIDNGLDPFQAATTIKGHLGKQFGGIINAIEKQEGKNFANWIGSLFGGGQSSRRQQRNVQPQAQQQAAPSAQKEQLLNQMRQMTQFITKGK